MPSLGVLDVVIGLMLVYILIALMCTAVSEIIEGWLKVRSVELERGIRELLQDKKGTNLARKLYEHPLIFGLFQGTYDPQKIKSGKYEKASTLPSYIPARNFALALMDLALPASASQASGAQGATAGRAVPAQLAMTQQGTTINVTPAPAAGTSATQVQALKQGLSKLGDDNVARALRTLIDAAGDDLAQARANIEQWFDSAMDRVSGRYKRHAQTVTLIIAAVIVGLLNADTIMIAKALTEDTALRQSLVTAAQEYAKADAQSAPPNAAADAADQPSPGNAKPASGTGEGCKKDDPSAQCKLRKSEMELQKLGLPLGWTRFSEDDSAGKRKRTDFPARDDGGAWLLKILGLLTTIIAVSLGAPFWFDALNKVMVVRATVKPKEKSPDEPPVDRPRP
jgi:hypothetical protein